MNVKIIDFSIWLKYNDIKSNNINLPFTGTPFYMCLEVIKSNTIDINDISKVDTYSLEIIPIIDIYRLLINLCFSFYLCFILCK